MPDSPESEVPFDESPLETLERLIANLPPGDPLRSELCDLRLQMLDQQRTMQEAGEMIEQLEEAVKKVTAPANRIGTFLGAVSRETAQVVVNGSEYLCNIDPRLGSASLKKGSRVLVNEAFAIVGDFGDEPGGPIAKVDDVLAGGRLRVGQGVGTQSAILQRGADLVKTVIKSGDEVRVDTNFRVALELIQSGEGDDHYLDQIPELPWEKVGGQEAALEAIRDAIELPLIHGDLFRRFQHSTPKGFLLYGPPGCGKTLIGKATAYNLTSQLQAKTGRSMREYFMHIKGPEVLNMWLGESERIVRDIFSTAREKRREGYLPFIFIDEAESILGTRRASRHANILSTLVPMFCTEMDGIDSLEEVVIILASNRADLIDPAILRPGRIDRKIKVNRPGRDGASAIYRIYLSSDLPIDPALVADKGSVDAALDYLAERLVAEQFDRSDANRFLEVTLRSGKKEMLYRGDLVSGAIIASVVERAKELAIKRAIHSDHEEGISLDDLLVALRSEYEGNDIFPPDDITEDWLKLIDYDADNVVRVSPVRLDRPSKPSAASDAII